MKIEEILKVSDDASSEEVSPESILKAISFISTVYDKLYAKMKTKDSEINSINRRIEEPERSQSTNDNNFPDMASKLDVLDQENRS